MFFFSHQTDRLNSFILTDFSCSLSNVEKITSTILPMASNIFSSPAFSALFELILSHNARIAPSNKLKNSSKCRYKIVEFILSTLLKRGKTHCLAPFYLIGYQNDAKCRSIDLLAAYAVVQPASAFGSSIKHRGMVLQTKSGAQ